MVTKNNYENKSTEVEECLKTLVMHLAKLVAKEELERQKISSKANAKPK